MVIMVTKQALESLYGQYYNQGVQLGMAKTATLSIEQIRKLLSSGSATELGSLGRAMGERGGGQVGTVFGGGVGALAGGIGGKELAALLGENPVLAAALATGGGAAGALGLGAAGNIAGRALGGHIGEASSMLNALPLNRGVANYLADPLKRVPGIRG